MKIIPCLLQQVEKTGSKMKAVEAKDFFASAAAPPTAVAVTKKKKDTSPNENKGSRANSKGSQAATKDVKKRKSPDVEFHDDPDFAAMLIDMDDKAGDGERLLKRFPTIHTAFQMSYSLSFFRSDSIADEETQDLRW